MNYNQLNDLTYSEMKNLCEDMGIKVRRSKEKMLSNIKEAFKEYETYKKNNIDKFTRISQIGNKGKEGTTYLVKDKNNQEYAMKTFRKQKSSSKLKKEAYLQELASKYDIAPKIFQVDTVSKYIVMEKMDRHLITIIKKQNGVLSKVNQKQIISILKKLDEAKVFHGDVNLLNYMFLGKKLYIIDFGMAKEITNSLIKKLGTNTPNIHIMTLGIILKLKEIGCQPSSYEYLSKFLNNEQIQNFSI